MKNIVSRIFLVFIAAGVISCGKKTEPVPRPLIVAKSDTSTTLISNVELVGDWNIVTLYDTVEVGRSQYYPGGSFLYHGTATDHYIFTKYANLFIKNDFNHSTDTAIYRFSGVDTLELINSHFSQGFSGTGVFIIKSIGPHSLIITQSGLTPDDDARPTYEEITFKK